MRELAIEVRRGVRGVMQSWLKCGFLASGLSTFAHCIRLLCKCARLLVVGSNDVDGYLVSGYVANVC